jgi:hypothetical protein
LVSSQWAGKSWATESASSTNRHANTAKKVLWTTVGTLIVLVVNMSYVSAVSDNKYSNETVQIIAFLLSVFKLVWNRILYLLHKNNHRLPWILQYEVGLRWLVSIALFNNLLIPYIAEALVSSNCFLYVLKSAPAIEVSYPTVTCDSQTLCSVTTGCQMTVGCDSMTLQSLSLATIVPTFEYSFQCSSSLLSAFAQVYVFRFVLCGLVQPALLLTVRMIVATLTAESPWKPILSTLLPLQWGLHAVIHSTASQPQQQQQQYATLAELLVSSIILTMVLDVAIVLTFGMLFPLLAVVGLLSIIKDVVQVRLLLGEWLSTTQQEGSVNAAFVDSLSAHWRAHRDSFHLLLLLVVWVATMLLSWTVFDTYGDVSGVDAAIWTVFVLPVVSGTALVAGFRLRSVSDSGSGLLDGAGQRDGDDVLRLTTIELTVNPLAKSSTHCIATEK